MSESVSTQTPGPAGARSASSSFVGAQASSRRKFISSCDSRDASPGSPERPRRLGADISAESSNDAREGRSTAAGASSSGGAPGADPRAGPSGRDSRVPVEWSARRGERCESCPRRPRRCREPGPAGAGLRPRGASDSDSAPAASASGCSFSGSVSDARISPLVAGASSDFRTEAGISAGSVAPSRVALS